MASTSSLRPGLVWLMAAATGISVASNYYAQPLLHTIAQDLGLSFGAVGLVVTVAQVGYTVGLVFLLPLGDMLERRGMIFLMTLVCAAGLLGAALSTGLGTLLASVAMAGMFSVVAQVLVPFAATLAAPEERGRVVGTVMSGLLLGILLARTVSGALAETGSWRAVYWFAAASMVILAFVLRRALPRHSPEASGLSYPQLLRSIVTLLAQEPVLRLRALLGAVIFANFSLLWTSIAFLLAGPPYNYSDVTIGLFGLAGAAGALAASRVGRLADRGHGNLATLVGLAVLTASWLPMLLARDSLAALLAGILLLDLAAQVVHISNQSAIYRLRPEARNRINAGYMTCYLSGGAVGSLLSAQAYQHAGWTGVGVAGLAIGAVGLAAWLRRPAGS
ncbi:MFS transporter [Pigmentiphaga soli]|uniref:MFS transporter n=1 Tax=Pigmentiphaga soli TaxID=1007095 RepID=A0ABP8H1C3_9BURK